MGKRQEQADAVEPQAEPQAEVKKLSLSKLAKKHGQWMKNTVGEDQHFKADHLSASVYHGWEYAHFNSGVEPSMSEADYLAALEAAKNGKVHGGADCRIKNDEVAK